MGATFSDRPPVTGPRYVFSPAVTETEEQGDVVDPLMSQLQGSGAIHGGAPTKPGERLRCTAVERGMKIEKIYM